MKIPQTLGRFEVVDLIAQGGMCVLYRARDPRIGRYVAIKLLRPEFDTPELRERFSREARAAGGLSHPNIVTIYDVGEYDGLPFIAMEYVRGETFADLVCLRPPLSLYRKLQLTEEVCAGLAHAHEAGIVHRDIKPANLIVGPEGTVKILDFGIAKLAATGTTLPGAVLGTLNFISPEQIKGTVVDARADIFALGAVLYELVSHQPAFPGEASEEVLHQILHGVPIPITEYCPDLDPRLVRLIDRALEKDPGRRFQSIASVQTELVSIRPGARGAVTTAPPLTRRERSGPATPDSKKHLSHEIEKHLTIARHAFDAGNYDAAIESCNNALLLESADQRALDYLDRIHAAIEARETAIRAAIERGKSDLERGNLTSTLREVKQALTLDPDNTEARTLGAAASAAIKQQQDDARVRAAIDEARRSFHKGDHQAALLSLEALWPASSPLVAAALQELRLALRDIEEQRRLEHERTELRRRIAALLADVKTALKSGRLTEAAQALETLREIDATVPELSGLTDRLHQAQAAARVKADVERALGEFEEQLARGELGRADIALNTAVALAPTDALVRSASQRLQQARDAVAAREAAEARRHEGERRIEDAAARLNNGDLTGAADMLRAAAALVPQHPRAAGLSEQLRDAVARRDAAEAAERLRLQFEALIGSASQHLQSADVTPSDLAVALREVNQALGLDVESADGAALKTQIEAAIAARREADRARTAIDNARRRFENGKHQAAIKLLEAYQPSSQPEIVAALNELRSALLAIEEQRRAERERIERQQRVATLLAEASTALQDQRFDAALNLAAEAETLDAAAPNLSAFKEQVRQELAAAERRAELERLLADLHERLALGELSQAADRLSTATALAPNEPRVLVARQRVAQAVAARDAAEARKRELADKHAAAAALFEHGDLQGAMRVLTLAVSLDPQHPETIRLSEMVRDAIKNEEAAEAAERLRRHVDELLAHANALLRSSDWHAANVRLAKQQLAEVLSLVPDHAGATALMVTADEELAALREAARIDAAVRNARSRFANGKHQSALQLLQGLDPSHPVVADALKELLGALHDIRERRRADEELADTAVFHRDAYRVSDPKPLDEAVDAPSAPRPIDATVTRRQEEHGQTSPSHEAPASVAMEKSAAADVDQPGHGPTPRGSQRIVREAVASEDAATVFVLVDESARKELAGPAAQSIENGAGTQVPAGDQIPAGIGPVARPWRLLLMVAAGLLLFALLIALVLARS